MKNFLLSISMLLVCVSGFAQGRPGTWSVIPRVGVNLANITHFEVFYRDFADGMMQEAVRKSEYREGMVGGLDVQYQVNEKLATSAGLFYSVQGMRFPSSEDIGDDKEHYASDGFQWTYNYLSLPIMLHGYGPKGLSVNAGIQIGYLLRAKGKGTLSQFTVDDDGKVHYLTDENGNYMYAYNAEYDILNVTKRLDISIPVGISYEYSHVVLDARYNFGLTKLNKHNADNYKNKVFSFTVGYRFEL